MIELLLVIIYLCFISLGLPDSLLGSAWPTLYKEINVPLSYAGIISSIISCGTIISAIFSGKLNHKLGTWLVTTLSIVFTAIALFGFSISTKFWMLIVFAIPFGLGAGGVDAALNNYVACNYKSHHMSFLHCMWGVGASISPYIMSYALTNQTWDKGYLFVSIIQACIAFIVFISLPLWKKVDKDEETIKEKGKAKSFKEILSIKGSKASLISFFTYCGVESVAMLWSSSYFALHNGISPVIAASLASLFYIGMTVGRLINGFLTFKINDKNLIRLGQGICLAGIVLMMIPLGNIGSYIAVVLIGLGCAPIYPCIIHSTPTIFGKENSQAMIGVQMAAAYIGTLSLSPLFGVIANATTISIMPYYLLGLMVVMVITHEYVERNKQYGTR